MRVFAIYIAVFHSVNDTTIFLNSQKNVHFSFFIRSFFFETKNRYFVHSREISLAVFGLIVTMAGHNQTFRVQ